MRGPPPSVPSRIPQRLHAGYNSFIMVLYRRNFVPGGTYFFTLTLQDRGATTLTDHIADLRAAFRRARAERPFTLEAIVVLPEHLHALLTLPTADADYPARLRRIKGLFSSAVAKTNPNMQPNRRGGYDLWQPRYWEHTIRDESDFTRHADYIHFNPVKHGIVSHVRDWPHSSFHRYVRDGILPADWGGDTNPPTSFGEPPPP